MGVGKNLRQQFHLSSFGLSHFDASDFYLSSWQKNRSIVPLLCIRAILFLGCLAILITSMVMMGLSLGFGLWFIYLTHWGLVMITVASGLSLLVSVKSYRKSRDFSLDLTWDVKCFWLASDVATTLAFLITIFYYTVLQVPHDLDDGSEFFVLNEVLDLFIHGINSVMMFLLIMTSRVPGRLLHFVYPLGASIVYLLFSVIYYFAGGVDPFGNNYIYPPLDWSRPGPTVIMVVLTAIGIIVVHWILVGIIALRDLVTRRYRRDSANINITNIPEYL